MKIRQPSLDYLRLLKGFWSTCHYQLNASWVYGIFETGLIFDNIFATVDLTEIFHRASFGSKLKLPIRIKFSYRPSCELAIKFFLGL